jgi:L-asparaginase/Glu-tRNA(Gln) amidotransferase subunit D
MAILLKIEQNTVILTGAERAIHFVRSDDDINLALCVDEQSIERLGDFGIRFNQQNMLCHHYQLRLLRQ